MEHTRARFDQSCHGSLEISVNQGIQKATSSAFLRTEPSLVSRKLPSVRQCLHRGVALGCAAQGHATDGKEAPEEP